jgi:hypothetical protein
MANEPINFASATNLAVGKEPFYTTVGDFNGDGNPDLATTNYQSNNVSILLGNGQGSFGIATNFTVGTNPFAITTADLNGDGILDLATANYLGNNVSILLGDGKGSFGTATNLAVGLKPLSITTGDFNGDGKSDLAVANDGTNLSVLLGNGNGSFGTATNVTAGIVPISVLAADLNGDGKSDLVSLNTGTSNSLSVLLGTGQGTFGTATTVAVGDEPGDLAIGDFNGDGIPDLATPNYKSGNVSILLGNGQGGFGTPTNFAAGAKPLSITAKDFNADGILDLAVANINGDNVSILQGNGNGSFGAANNIAVGSFPGLVVAGDFNRDGHPDLVTANRGTDNVSVLLNQTFVVAANKPPVVANPIATTQNINAGTALNLVLAANTFRDPDAGDVLTYAAKLEDGSTLPTWLTFNAATRTFAGTPGVGDVGRLNIAVTATDKAGLKVSTNFGLNVNSGIITISPNPNANKPPVVTSPISSGLIAGLTVEQNLLITGSTIKGFGISAVTQKPTNKVNEIGIFAVDDITGKIGSIAPGNAGYIKAVIDSAKPIFTSLAGDFFNKTNQELSIDPNKIYQFFEVQDGSIDELKQQIASGKTPTNLLFSLPDANGDSSIKVTSNSDNNGYKVSVNADELVLNVVKLTGATANSPIGSKSQTAPEGRTIDLTNFTGKTLKADITTTSSAAYTNNIGFYAVEDSIGSIKLSDGSILKPGDANYAAEAIKNAVANVLQAGKTDSKTDLSIAGGKIYAPVVVAQGTLAEFIAKNPTNGGGAENIHAYFNYIGANSDKTDHFRLIGNNTFGVEDVYGGGDRDFNDLVVNMNVKSV